MRGDRHRAVCGTSASSAPSRTAIWTPSASARSTTVRLNVRQRNAGSGPESRIRSRGARGMRTAWTSNSGQSIVRVTPSSSRTVGRVVWKSTNSSGSMLANDSAPRLPATNASADVADSPASFQPLKAHTSAGARRPSGRRSQRSGCMSSRYRVSIGAITTIASLPARRRPRRRRLRLLAQGPADGALRLALPRARVPRQDGHDRGPRLPRRRRARRPLREGRPRARGRPRRALPRRAPARGARRHARPRRTDPTSFLPGRLPRPRRARRLPRAPGARGPRPGLPRASWIALLGDAALRAEWRRAPCTRAGHHAYLGGLLEHTVAVGTLALEACQLHPRLNSDLLITAALVHDLGKTREFTYGAEIGLSDEGRLLGHVVLGQQLLDRLRAAGRPAAGAHALRARPPRGGRVAGAPVRVGGGARRCTG